jgi:hypothetical protein
MCRGNLAAVNYKVGEKTYYRRTCASCARKGKRVKENFFRESVSNLKLKSGNLSLVEKKELIRLLAYLENFHTNIYFNDPGLSFEEMIEKHIL